MGCAFRSAEDKADRFPTCKAEVTWPYLCEAYPSLQLLAKCVQESTAYWKGGTIVGGKLFTYTSCAVISGTICVIS